MRSLDEGLEWHPATIWQPWNPESSLSLLAAVILAVLVGLLTARAVTVHSRSVSLSASSGAVQRIAIKGPQAWPVNDAPAIWMAAALMETSRLDDAFPAAAVVPRKAGKQGARSGGTFARRKHVPSKAHAARRRAPGKQHMARAPDRRRIALRALGKRRRMAVARKPARQMEVARGRKVANSRRARANRAGPVNHRRSDKPRVTQQRRSRPG